MRESREKDGGDVQVFMPSISMYLPLGEYPLATTGGILQQA